MGENKFKDIFDVLRSDIAAGVEESCVSPQVRRCAGIKDER